MKRLLRRTAAILTAFVMSILSIPGAAQANAHVVSPSELHHELQEKAGQRQANLDGINRLLSAEATQKALAKVGLEASQVESAVAQLNDEELSRLAERARAAEEDLEGGIIITLLALIGLIVVIVFVVRAVS